MSEKETVFVLCENGTVMAHDLPLPSGIADRVARKQLHLVNEDGSPLDHKAEAVSGDVPAGTIDDVLAWVGDDKTRAQRALDVEQDKGEQARSTLVAKLTALVQE